LWFSHRRAHYTNQSSEASCVFYTNHAYDRSNVRVSNNPPLQPAEVKCLRYVQPQSINFLGLPFYKRPNSITCEMLILRDCSLWCMAGNLPILTHTRCFCKHVNTLTSDLYHVHGVGYKSDHKLLEPIWLT